MPEFTIYNKIIRTGKRKHKVKNTPVHRVHQRWPCDWKDLEGEFLQAARNTYRDFKQTESEMTFERHLAGKGKKSMINYRESRIHFNRSLEVAAKIIYTPKTEHLKISAVNFCTPEAFSRYKFDYDTLTKKGKYKFKELSCQAVVTELLDPDSIFHNQIGIKTPNYDPMPIGIYATQQERNWSTAIYDAIPHGVYGSNDSSVESDTAERQSKIKG
jgi:hypothetical protein